MKLSKSILLGQFLAVLLTVDPLAQGSVETSTDPIAPCDARAYVVDRDPAGLNVRSGPGKTFKTIRNLPNQEVEGIGVHITGAIGDWVRIDRAIEEGGEQERIFFQGEGWVYAPLLGVGGMAITNGGTNLYKEPKEKSRVVIRIPGGEDRVIVRSCRGRWMYVEYKKVRGWAAPDTLCANSLTTCV
jgi:SH3-like domain-containing protein